MPAQSDKRKGVMDGEYHHHHHHVWIQMNEARVQWHAFDGGL
jgi:hypothetical protein